METQKERVTMFVTKTCISVTKLCVSSISIAVLWQFFFDLSSSFRPSRETAGKSNISNQGTISLADQWDNSILIIILVSGLMRDQSGTIENEYMDTQESVTGVQSRLICHVPDFVWQAEDQVIETPKAIMTNGVLLFADVSGFTALTERYSNHREGVSGLTHALNGYIRYVSQPSSD